MFLDILIFLHFFLLKKMMFKFLISVFQIDFYKLHSFHIAYRSHQARNKRTILMNTLTNKMSLLTSMQTNRNASWFLTSGERPRGKRMSVKSNTKLREFVKLYKKKLNKKDKTVKSLKTFIFFTQIWEGGDNMIQENIYIYGRAHSVIQSSTFLQD